MQFADLPAHCQRLMDALEMRLAGAPDTWWAESYAPGKWKRVELAGHLIDSASNNHQRFVRALLTRPGEEFSGPGYDQEGSVRVERFAAEAPAAVAALLVAYNRHLAHVFAGFPADRLNTVCRIGGDAPVTLERLALDYVAHLEHHLRQLTGPGAALPYSGLPWPPPAGSN